jgi:hypothetical protein
VIEREWKEGKYGKSVVKKADELFNNTPVSVTDCLLSSSKYMFKFHKAKRRSI